MKNSTKLLIRAFTLAFISLSATAFAGDPQAPVDPAIHAPPIVVACVGDSLTADASAHGYPNQLGNMLGAPWKVENFGVSGTTLIHVGKPYQQTAQFQQALASKADVVVIMLGSNDTKTANWAPHKQFFVADYKDLIEKFKAMESKPRIFIMKPTYLCPTNRLTLSDAALIEQQPLVDQIGKDENVGVLDAHTPTAGHEEYYHDGAHPKPYGAGVIAKVVYEGLTGKTYSGPIPNYPH